MTIGYLVNCYPRPSHSFIRREIRALERAGHRVHRFAIRGDFAALVDPADRSEHERTERILEAGPTRLLAATIGAAARAISSTSPRPAASPTAAGRSASRICTPISARTPRRSPCWRRGSPGSPSA